MKWSALGPPVAARLEPSRSVSSCETWLLPPRRMLIAAAAPPPVIALMPEVVPASTV